MRQIVFRGKRIDNGEWVYGFYALFASNKGLKYGIYTGAETGCVIPYEVAPETVGQFTGLTDKNGKKIFEDDIIRYSDLYDYDQYLESIENPEAYDDIDLSNIWTIDKVVYGENVDYPAFDLSNHDFENNGICELAISEQYFYEVIGNIYDNKELLEEKK